MSKRAEAIISQANIRHNLQVVKRFAPNSAVLAMLKANAYGHGLVMSAHALGAADAFGVASLDEAIQLRQMGINKEIVLMEGVFRAKDLDLVERYDLTMVVHHAYQIAYILAHKKTYDSPFIVWVKIDTGMNRLGFRPEEFTAHYATLQESENVKIKGFMSHFPQADERENNRTCEQLDMFEQMTEGKAGLRSLANSAAIIAWPQTHLNWVRPGLMLYGASPFLDKTAHQHGLKPAMTLRSEIIALKQVHQGESVGYTAKWSNHGDQKTIAIVAIGYGDGYPWGDNITTPVKLNGTTCYTVGRVSMDMLAVDVTHATAQIGDSVELWGESLPIEDVSRAANTIPYEIFCQLTSRVHYLVA